MNSLFLRDAVGFSSSAESTHKMTVSLDETCLELY